MHRITAILTTGALALACHHAAGDTLYVAADGKDAHCHFG